MFLAMFTTQLPLLFVSIVGAVFVLTRWTRVPVAAAWALSGLILSIIICIGMPLVQTLVQTWAMQDMPGRAATLSAVGILWSLGRAISYGLLLVAVFAGRREGSP